ncbi:MAG: sigma-70 family RNA polymerase sigma factor [Bacteroidales bacterium]|nr:sigma-70 family RNA polymerase sigma factor [Bacteroidales bacterium]
MMNKYTDEEIIKDLRQRKRSCIDYLYKEYFPLVRHHVKQNSGNDQDVEDVFQDTLVVLYKRSLEEPFTLKCSLKTFFVSVCKNLWLQRLDYKYRLMYHADYSVYEDREYYTLEDQYLKEEILEQNRLLYKNLMKMSPECRRILQLYCLKIPYKEIAAMMKLKDEVYVKTRKYYCKNLLRKKILNDPECHQFLKNYGNRNHLRLD